MGNRKQKNGLTGGVTATINQCIPQIAALPCKLEKFAQATAR